MNAVADRPSLESRLVLAQVDCCTLAFPAEWVAEIARFQKSQILQLPFYQPPFMGLMHQNGQVISLVSAAQLLGQSVSGGDMATVVRLSASVGQLDQVGVVVDKVIGGTTRAEVADSILQAESALPKSLESGATVLLRQEWFSQKIWQPQQWDS